MKGFIPSNKWAGMNPRPTENLLIKNCLSVEQAF